MKREEVIQIIEDLADDLDCAFAEAAFNIIDEKKKKKGVCGFRSKKEYAHLSDEELIDCIWDLYPYDGEIIDYYD